MKLILCVFVCLYLLPVFCRNAPSLLTISSLLKAKQKKNEKAVKPDVNVKPGKTLVAASPILPKTSSSIPIIPKKSKGKFGLTLSSSLSLLPFIAFGLSMLVSKFLRFEDKQIKLKIRISYGAYMALSQLLIWYIKRIVLQKDDQSSLEIPAALNPLSMLAANLPDMLPASPAMTVTTVKEYDLDLCQKLLSSTLTEGAMAIGIHLFFKKIGAESCVFNCYRDCQLLE